MAIIKIGKLNKSFEDPLSYEHVRLNQGGAWSSSLNAVVIATPGIYYVFVTMHTCQSARAILWFRVNRERIFEVKSKPTGRCGQTRSNGAVIRLAAGDKLTVEVANSSRTCLYSSPDRMNSFFGLLLSPANV